jgi:hypothetical protein
MVIEPYRPVHRDACLALFNSNVPSFFLANEKGEFESFLDAPPGPYFVGRRGEEIVAAGGYAEDLREPGTWILCWGMVAAHLHQQGLGRTLLTARIQAMRKLPGFQRARINTSQHTCGFFERFGFVVIEVAPDGFGQGLHRYAMLLASESALRPNANGGYPP